MNYISQLNGFWRWRQMNIISPKAMLLYFAILNFANLSRWQDSFPIPTEQLIAITGLGKNELSICRKELAEHKLIYYERGYRGQPAHYKLNLLYPEDNKTTPVFGNSSGYIVTALNKDIYKLNNLLNKYIYKYIYNNQEILKNDTDVSTGSKAVGHACSYNNLSLTAERPVEETKGSTTDGPAGSVKRCVDCFTSAIHPFFSVKEADMIKTLICENGEKAFIGAVKYAQSKGIKHRNTWKWLQTVLDNGDWKKGYEDTENLKKPKTVSQIPVITPDEIFV